VINLEIQDVKLNEEKVEDKGVFVEGFSLNGEFVKNLEDNKKDTKFEIIDMPAYEELPDIDQPGKVKRKLVLKVRLADNTELKYYPNKTAQQSIIKNRGYRLDQWRGFIGQFFTEKMKIGANTREVIYIQEEVGKKLN